MVRVSLYCLPLCLLLAVTITETVKTNSVTDDVEVPRKKLRKGRTRHPREDNVCDLEISCRGEDIEDDEEEEVQAPVRLPIRGPRGPSGTPGDKGDKGTDGLQGLPGLPGISAPVPQKVAFFVGLKNSTSIKIPIKEDAVILFDMVLTNVGEAYDIETGHFIAPVNGTYQFNIVVSAQTKQKAAVMLTKNSKMLVTVWAESIPRWSTASNSVIINLQEGDLVRLVLLERASYLYGFMYTTFSGFLMF